MLGLAVGDALGTTVEFMRPGRFAPVTDIVGGGPFSLKPGQWTDDTSMALCLAESLIECGGFDAEDQMRRYVQWWKQGYLSCTGTCFDIGMATRSALQTFLETQEPYCGSRDPQTAGNGSLMRLAPVPLFFHRSPHEAIQYAGVSSRTTHAAPEAVDACRYAGGLIVGALQGADKRCLLAPRYSPVPDLWYRRPLAQAVDAIAAGSFSTREPPDIKGSGYVVRSLEAALWAFHRTSSFAEGALRVVNLGDDADTTGAIYGQLAGAYYGWEGIPSGWRSKVAMADRIIRYAERLYEGPSTLGESAKEGTG